MRQYNLEYWKRRKTAKLIRQSAQKEPRNKDHEEKLSEEHFGPEAVEVRLEKSAPAKTTGQT